MEQFVLWLNRNCIVYKEPNINDLRYQIVLLTFKCPYAHFGIFSLHHLVG